MATKRKTTKKKTTKKASTKKTSKTTTLTKAKARKVLAAAKKSLGL